MCLPPTRRPCGLKSTFVRFGSKRIWVREWRCPLLHQKRTNADAVGLFIKCQKRTFPLNDRRLKEKNASRRSLRNPSRYFDQPVSAACFRFLREPSGSKFWLLFYYFWDWLELRALAHGSTFFRGWSGIAFNFDLYSLSTSFLYASVAGSTGWLFNKFIFGWNWASADPLSAIDKTIQLMSKMTAKCCRELMVIMASLH